MRRLRFMFAAIVLLVLAAWLMHGRDAVRAENRAKDVRMPRFPTPDEYQRRTARRTLMERAREVAADDTQPPPAKRDPLLLVLPYDEHKGSVIVEASAIRFSELGEQILDCLNKDVKESLDRMREETGIDLLDSIDRIGVSDQGVVLTGNFQGLVLKEERGQKYGDHGTILHSAGAKDGAKVGAVWNDEVMMLDVTEDEAEEMIDRLEGRSERTTPTFPEHMEYGEVYGWLPVEALAQMIPDEGDRQLRERLTAAADKVELHVSVANDVGIVARVSGKDESIRDLGKSIGGAMALGRTFAASREEKALAEILELGRVVPHGNTFDVELALPSDVLLKQLGGECGKPRDAGTSSVAADRLRR